MHTRHAHSHLLFGYASGFRIGLRPRLYLNPATFVQRADLRSSACAGAYHLGHMRLERNVDPPRRLYSFRLRKTMTFWYCLARDLDGGFGQN